jgi:hypothetical protein
MRGLALVLGYTGMAAGFIAGNVEWLLCVHRKNLSNMDWIDGPWAHWKELTRCERRRMLLLAAITLGSFFVVAYWRAR